MATKAEKAKIKKKDERSAEAEVFYELDFDKILTLEDVKAVLRVLRLRVSSYDDLFDELEPYLKTV